MRQKNIYLDDEEYHTRKLSAIPNLIEWIINEKQRTLLNLDRVEAR